MTYKPLPKWMFSDDQLWTRHFVVHTEAPRFTAEILDSAISGLTYELYDGRVLCNFHWLDEPPGTDRLVELFGAADRAMEIFDAYTDAAVERGEMEDEENH